MADNTKIEWSDATWNPVTGCTKVSTGCDNCYAETFAERFRGVAGHHFEDGFDLTLRPERLDQPLRWKRPRRIFANSMSDLFHDSVPDDFIARVFAVMSQAPQHQFQLLTKRHGRMRHLLNSPAFRDDAHSRAIDLVQARAIEHPFRWPLPNCWLGVSVENQQWADIRIPALLATPAAVRWVSAEPLLGPVDLGNAALRPYERQQGGHWDYAGADPYGNGKTWVPAPSAQLDWVVVGGESGPGARPMHPAWARQLRDQCAAAGVPFLFKQWGQWVTEDQSPEDITLPSVSWSLLGDDAPAVWNVGKKAAGRELDGRTWDQYPQPAGVPA